MEQEQIQNEIENHLFLVNLFMQRIENKSIMTLPMIDLLIMQMKHSGCLEEPLLSLIIDKCAESDKKAFFDKYLIEDTCDLVMRRGKVVYSFQGEYDYKRYRILIQYYKDNWLYNVPIKIIRKLADKYPEVKDTILPTRETKYFAIDWSWVTFFDGYLVIEKSNNTNGIIFDRYVYTSPSIRAVFNSLLFLVKKDLKTVGCTVRMRKLSVDETSIIHNIGLLKQKYDSFNGKDNSSSNNTSTTHSYHGGGGGWGPKYGTEYVSEHHRSGHWRRCASGKVVWVNACTVSGHSRTY